MQQPPAGPVQPLFTLEDDVEDLFEDFCADAMPITRLDNRTFVMPAWGRQQYGGSKQNVRPQERILHLLLTPTQYSRYHHVTLFSTPGGHRTGFAVLCDCAVYGRDNRCVHSELLLQRREDLFERCPHAGADGAQRRLGGRG
jgi:hypothetical protein